MANGTVMTNQAMQQVLDGLQPGDRFRMTFADLPVDEYRIQMIAVLCMSTPGSAATLKLGEMGMFTLQAVVETRRWEDFRTYEATVLQDFDPEDFAYRTLRHGLLESIEKF